MLTDKQRVRLDRALASDPARTVAPPDVAQLIDWLEWRALRVCNVRRTRPRRAAPSPCRCPSRS